MCLSWLYLLNINNSRHLVELKMSLEACPFCGKPFKRLKAHLPHCKMSLESKTSQITKKPKQIQTSTLKHTSNKTNQINAGTALNHTLQASSKSPVKPRAKKVETMSVGKESVQNTCTSTASKNPSTEGINTDTLMAKTKWLSKREQEMMKQAKLQTHERVSQQEKYNSEAYDNPVKGTHLSEKEIANELNQPGGANLTSQLTPTKNSLTASDPLQSVPRITDCQIKQSILKCQENANVSGSMQNSLMTKEYSWSSRLKEKGVSVFQTKTCVWDHIKHGLYERKHDCVPVLSPKVSTRVSFTKCVNTSESVLKPITGNAIMKTSSVQIPIFQASDKRPFKDSLSSRVQNVPVMAYSPEMATGYGGIFLFTSHSQISSDENLLMKSQPSKPSPLIQGVMTERRLGDVRLNELGSWLVARSPASPNEAVTMFNRGWQWYYRKYIDVQKGGIGGIAMLIGGYCVLSYIWSYSHIKKERWRKYH